MNIGGVGSIEIIMILVIGLIVLGPNRMVDTARTLGKTLRSLQKAASEIPNLMAVEEELENHGAQKDDAPQGKDKADPPKELSDGPVPFRRDDGSTEEAEGRPPQAGGNPS